MKYFMLAAVLGAFLFVSGPAPVLGQDGSREDPKVRAMIERGLVFLAKEQQSNGSWRCLIYKKGAETESKINENVGVTALACLAFMGDGNLPDRGPYAETVARGLEFVMNCVQDNGYITANDTRMYEHGFATLFLAEMYGMTKRKDVRHALQKAVDLMVKSQNERGSWRYVPAPVMGDLSVTVTLIQSLRAARNVGLTVPKEIIEKAFEYVRGCEAPQGGFYYQHPKDAGDHRTSYALTSAGLVCLYGLGYYDEKKTDYEKHFKVLSAAVNGANIGGQPLRYASGLNPGAGHFYYGNYYAAQAFYQRGGEDWKKYYGKMISILESLQDKKTGQWKNEVHPSYDTAMACIILQMPREYLPIMQK